MSFVWTQEQIGRYQSYYEDLRTHHTTTYARFETTTEFARSVLPPCLTPAETPVLTVGVLAFIEWLHGVPNRAGRDRAAFVGLNARFGDREGSYYLNAIEEEEVNIVTGRELWGTPKKQGTVDFFEDGEEMVSYVTRKGHRLIEFSGLLGEAQPLDGDEESEYYFELRGHFGANGRGLREPELVIFETPSLIKRSAPVTDVSLTLTGSPVDPGFDTIPVGAFIDGGHIGGETSYVLQEVVELKDDGHDYAPYLMGRLYDDWPDVREPGNRRQASAAAR